MVWEKSRGTEFPRCAHSCIAVSFKDAIIAGVLTSSPNESDVESTTQDGLILYGGFSGNNVENSVLFITEGNIPTLLLSCWLHIMMVPFADQQTPFPSLPFLLKLLFADLSTVLDISGQIGGKAPTPSFAQVALPIVNESGFTEVWFGLLFLPPPPLPFHFYILHVLTPWWERVPSSPSYLPHLGHG